MCTRYNPYSDPDKKGDGKPLPQRNIEWTRQVLKKYGRHIRHLSASSLIMTNLIAECGVLEQLQLLKTVWIDMMEPPYNLSNLTLWMTIPKTLTAAEDGALKGMVRPGAKFPKRLSKDTWVAARRHWLLILKLPGLCHLRLFSRYTPLGFIISPSFMRRALAVHYRTLASLQIGFTCRHQLDLEEYLEVLPNLQHLFTGYNPVRTKRLNKAYPKLRTLLINKPLSLLALYSLLEHLPGLEHLGVAHIQEFEVEDHDDPEVVPEYEGETWSASKDTWPSEFLFNAPCKKLHTGTAAYDPSPWNDDSSDWLNEATEGSWEGTGTAPEDGSEWNFDDVHATLENGQGTADGDEKVGVSERNGQIPVEGTHEGVGENSEDVDETHEGVELKIHEDGTENSEDVDEKVVDVDENVENVEENVENVEENVENVEENVEDVEENVEDVEENSDSGGDSLANRDWTPDNEGHSSGDEIGDSIVHNEASFLDRIPGRLRGLHLLDDYIHPRDSFKMDNAVNLFFNLPFLTEITIGAGYPDVAPMLARHCTQLQVFRSSDNCRSIHWNVTDCHAEHNKISILLERCPRLRVLDAIVNTIDANHLLKRPWLTGFRRRLNDMEDRLYDNAVRMMEATGYESLSVAEQRAIDLHQKCQDQHLQVYDRLASLTRLTTLDLGHEFIETDYDQYDFRDTKHERFTHGGRTYWEGMGPIRGTMELSLSSGLDRLGKLENLEVFGFQGVDHRIERPELEWMAKAWPRLRTMRGLHYSYVYYKEEDAATSALREKMKVLRPDVNHEGVPYRGSLLECLRRLFPMGNQ
ncbi:hypothetical protein BGZ97_011063 [Linnemannia gamsii]|uniref:Uncharacterized protein n=1 Tax=Linnemannia gamsii TaxID=64522 RepID=A0A9P6R707_9FUNG|nr:hypothetical protein BGZ97_011063 [Linnemannia gamsii]